MIFGKFSLGVFTCKENKKMVHVGSKKKSNKLSKPLVTLGTMVQSIIYA